MDFSLDLSIWLPALSVIALLSLALALLGWVIDRLHRQQARSVTIPPQEKLAKRINAALPGIQCGQCGYPGCEPYARAIAFDQEAYNLCPPGGEATARQLALYLGKEPLPVHSSPQYPALADEPERELAHIHTPDCIGCTLCIKACPVDAIVGSEGCVHTVVPDLCTGCQLCLAPCPTDCISMLKKPTRLADWDWPWPDASRPPPPPRT